MLNRPGSAALQLIVVVGLSLLGCEDPPDPGGLVLVVRTDPAEPGSRFAAAHEVHLDIERVEVRFVPAEGGGARTIVVARDLGDVDLPNASHDIVIGMFEVPAGIVEQVRIFVSRASLVTASGVVELEPESSDLPSWAQTGWKHNPADGEVIEIVAGELTGMRSLMDFDDRLVRTGHGSWKIKPTLEAVAFEVNPRGSEPGLFADELVVVFQESVPLTRVLEINAGVDAEIVRYPQLGTGYRVRFPPSTNLREAYSHFGAQPEVRGILPSVNLVVDAVVPDRSTTGSEDTNLLAAWNFVDDLPGTLGVGDYAIRVAFVDTGVKYDDPETYLNIAINAAELPEALFPTGIGPCDTDADGTLSFVDLNAIAGMLGHPCETVVPGDANASGFIDGGDVLADPRWMDGVDRDSNALMDDIVGWDFSGTGDADASADPSTTVGGDTFVAHGPAMMQVLAALGDNGAGTVGTIWRVSVIPVRVAAGRTLVDEFLDTTPMATVLDGLNYSERAQPDVVLLTSGWTFASKSADLSHRTPTRRDSGLTTRIPGNDFVDALLAGRAVFSGPPWVDPTIPSPRPLYVFSAGSNTLSLTDPSVARLPGTLIRDAFPARVIPVGAAFRFDGTGPLTSTNSNFGEGVLFAPQGWTVLDPFVGSPQSVAETSVGAALVAGTAGLVLTANPTLRGDPDALRTLLFDSARYEVDGIDDFLVGFFTDAPYVDPPAAVMR